MQTRQFGQTGIQITPLGCGAWAIGGGEWAGGRGPQDDRESIAAIHYDSVPAASVREEIENSLRRLRTDTLDLVQIHWPDPQEQIEAGWATLAELVDTLREIDARHGRSPGEVAIAWTLRLSAVTGAIVGRRRRRQVAGIVGTAEFRLADDERAESDVAHSARQRAVGA